MRVCVALSVKDGERFLAESIDSVLAQRGADFELRVYDNGSTDGTLGIVRRYLADPRVSLVQNPPGMWFPGSMNRAALETDCELFVPWACDDVMLPGNLAAKAEALEQTDAAIAFGPMLVIDEEGRDLYVSAPGTGPEIRVIQPLDWFPFVAPMNTVPLPSVMMRTEALRAIGGFDQRFVLACDWGVWLRLSLRVPAVAFPAPSVRYRTHENTTAKAWRDGGWAHDLPGTLWGALEDPAFPAGWEHMRPEMMLKLYEVLASGFRQRGQDRFSNSPLPAYALLADAVLRLDAHAGALAAFRTAVRGAGLAVPGPGCAAVVAAPVDAGEAAAVFRLLRRLVSLGVCGSVLAAAAEDALDTAAEVIGAELESGPDLDVTLAPAASPADALAPGMVAVCRFGDRLALAAERRGVPALVYGAPDPASEPRDAGLYDFIPTPAAAR